MSCRPDKKNWTRVDGLYVYVCICIYIYISIYLARTSGWLINLWTVVFFCICCLYIIYIYVYVYIQVLFTKDAIRTISRGILREFHFFFLPQLASSNFTFFWFLFFFFWFLFCLLFSLPRSGNVFANAQNLKGGVHSKKYLTIVAFFVAVDVDPHPHHHPHLHSHTLRYKYYVKPKPKKK